MNLLYTSTCIQVQCHVGYKYMYIVYKYISVYKLVRVVLACVVRITITYSQYLHVCTYTHQTISSVATLSNLSNLNVD